MVTSVASAALRQAEAEGLTLLRSESSRSGYKGVGFNSGRPKPYHAQLRRGGKQLALGYFTTAEEAALSYARTPEAQAAAAAAAAPPAPPPLTAEEALRLAEAEGRTLLRSASGISGFKGVSFLSKLPPARQDQALPRAGEAWPQGCDPRLLRDGGGGGAGLCAHARGAGGCGGSSGAASATADDGGGGAAAGGGGGADAAAV